MENDKDQGLRYLTLLYFHFELIRLENKYDFFDLCSILASLPRRVIDNQNTDAGIKLNILYG